jgi:hypothetical protein
MTPAEITVHAPELRRSVTVRAYRPTATGLSQEERAAATMRHPVLMAALADAIVRPNLTVVDLERLSDAMLVRLHAAVRRCDPGLARAAHAERQRIRAARRPK